MSDSPVRSFWCICSSKVGDLSCVSAAGGGDEGDGSDGASYRVWMWWISDRSLLGEQVQKRFLQHAVGSWICRQQKQTEAYYVVRVHDHGRRLHSVVF